VDLIPLPPGQAPAELEGAQIRENLVVEKAAQPRRIVAAYLERISHRVTGVALSLCLDNRRYDSITYLWIFCHLLLISCL
jgi:hypothetical protein